MMEVPILEESRQSLIKADQYNPSQISLRQGTRGALRHYCSILKSRRGDNSDDTQWLEREKVEFDHNI